MMVRALGDTGESVRMLRDDEILFWKSDLF
jgi:hypothetical protein